MKGKSKPKMEPMGKKAMMMADKKMGEMMKKTHPGMEHK